MIVKELIEQLSGFNQDVEVHLQAIDENPINEFADIYDVFSIIGSKDNDGVFIVYD